MRGAMKQRFTDAPRRFSATTVSVSQRRCTQPSRQTCRQGWECILQKELCCPNAKGCDKILVVFFCFQITLRQPRELWEVLAGVVKRYAVGRVGMKAFVAPFHHMKRRCGDEPVDRARRSRSGWALADSSARFCIEMAVAGGGGVTVARQRSRRSTYTTHDVASAE